MSSSQAPERLVAWWRTHKKAYEKFPFEISFHHRSDDHSNVIAKYVLDDLFAESARLKGQIRSRCVHVAFHEVVGDHAGLQQRFELVIASSESPSEIRLALKLKPCMTNHSAATVRLRNELASAARCVSEVNPHALVGGLVLVNTSASFVSPTDQLDPLPTSMHELRRRRHVQPRAAVRVIDMLERLPIRSPGSPYGLDALGVVVVHHDNELPEPNVALIAPTQDRVQTSLAYAKFIADMCSKYEERFG